MARDDNGDLCEMRMNHQLLVRYDQPGRGLQDKAFSQSVICLALFDTGERSRV